MIPVKEQLAFARTMYDAMIKSDGRKVREGSLSRDQATHRHEALSSILSTLERQVYLEEVTQEMLQRAARRAA